MYIIMLQHVKINDTHNYKKKNYNVRQYELVMYIIDLFAMQWCHSLEL